MALGNAGPVRDGAGDTALRRYYAERAPAYDAIYAKPERQADLRAIERWLPGQFSGCRTLELACGTGYWTPWLASAASAVVAVDAAAPTLALAQARCASVPAEATGATAPAAPPALTAVPVEFLLADVWSLPFAVGSFDAAFAGHWFSHVTIARRRDFMAGLCRVLAPGARVVMLDNRYVEGSSTPIAEVDAAGDSWQRRPRPGGQVERVLKNFPTRADLADAIAGCGEALEWTDWTYYWACSFRAAA